MSRTATLAAAAVAAVAFTATTPAQAQAPSPRLEGVVKTSTVRACEQEDSINCFWDAHGVGHDFYSVRVGGKLCIVYMERAFNRQNGYCYKLPSR